MTDFEALGLDSNEIFAEQLEQNGFAAPRRGGRRGGRRGARRGGGRKRVSVSAHTRGWPRA